MRKLPGLTGKTSEAGRIPASSDPAQTGLRQRLKPERIQSTLFMPSGGLIWLGG